MYKVGGFNSKKSQSANKNKNIINATIENYDYNYYDNLEAHSGLY